MKTLIAYFFIGLFLVAILLIFLLSQAETTKYYKFGFEVAKLTAQLMLIAFFGGILLQEYNRRRERKEARNEFRKSILKNLHYVYTDTKKSRRNLRAKCLETDSGKIISRSDYHKEMENINDAQLRLEVILLEIETFQEAFSETVTITKSGKSKIVPKLWVPIKAMEKCLDLLITEYENALSAVSETEPLICEKLDNMNKFIQKTREMKEDNPFKIEFADKFKESLEILETENLKI